MVLLKNEDNLLPLQKGTRILVAGPLADETNYMTSRYGPNGHTPISILKGLRDYLGDGQVVYVKGCDTKDENFPLSEIYSFPMTEVEQSGIAAAVEAAAGVDVIVAVMGEDATLTGESLSRTSLELPGRQNALLDALLTTGKPVVVVLVNGQPLTINRADRDAGAILEAWWPGFRGGYVVARTLFGEYNPGGKLTVTFPRTVGQLEYSFPFKPGSHGGQPLWGPNGGGVTRVVGNIYPFGHGLSYTTFEYNGLSVKSDAEGWLVSCVVANTGKRAGDEVAQLYIRDLMSSVTTYDSVLRGFERIHLVPGEKRTVEFRLRPDDLKLVNKNMEWVLEPGDFEIMMGSSSKDLRLKTTMSVK
jgi:beta-glucosidase